MADQLECYWRRKMRRKLRNELLALAISREMARMVLLSVTSVAVLILVFKYLIWS